MVEKTTTEKTNVVRNQNDVYFTINDWRKKSKCCPKCRKRREKRLLKQLGRDVTSRSRSRTRSRSSSSSSSSGSDWWSHFRGSRSPSIPIDPNRTSPSHLELRRITSARKLPIPYDRKWTSSDSDSDDSYYTQKTKRHQGRRSKR